MGTTPDRPPFWFMRQAGRYLPEYRKIRAEAGSFLDLCYAPELAAEVTMQPLRRYGMDGVILFSDILVVPHGLGQAVDFREGEGPVLSALDPDQGIGNLRLDRMEGVLAPVYEALSRVKSMVPAETAVIGFAGAPWTVATYMVEGGTSKDFSRIKQWAYGDPEGFAKLIDLLVEATTDHLSRQIDAGAEVVQLFDSWAGVLPPKAFEAWCQAPVAKIIAALKTRHPEVPVIAFPRGAGAHYGAYARGIKADCIGLDTVVPARWAAAEIPSAVAVQGNLDPILVVVGGSAMLDAAAEILEVFGSRPFVFNLGHGIVPNTPPENVAALSDFLRDWRR